MMALQKVTLFKSLHTLFARLFSRRVHFSKEYVGKTLSMEDGKKFQLIRDLRVNPRQYLEKTASVFKVRFKFSGLSLAVNKRLSMIPAPFLIVKSGFRQKIWTISEDGYFQGIYQWVTKEHAETYPDSFIFKLMAKRSEQGTLTYEVIPDMILIEYIENLVLPEGEEGRDAQSPI